MADEPVDGGQDPALEGSAAASEEAGEAAEAVAEAPEAPAPEPATDAQPEATDAAPAESPEEPAAEAEPEAEPEPEREPDPVRDPMLARITEILGDGVVGSQVAGGDLWVRVAPSSWRAAHQAARDQLGMDYFCFLAGLDWLPNPGMSAEKVWDPDETSPPIERPEAFATGVAGGDTRFQVFSRVYSTTTKVGITFKVDLAEDAPAVDSLHDLYPGADWHERETWEMYGFDFTGHPSLRHLYLPGGFEGHPLRKDFPLLAREVKPWPGLVDLEPLPGGDDDASEGGE